MQQAYNGRLCKHLELGDLINKYYAIPETNTRRFAPLIINSRGQRLKKQPDYSITKRRRPVAGDDKQTTQNDPQQ